MGRLVIVAYRPKPGKAEALDALMLTHVPRLRSEGLATDRESVLMRSADGTIIEVFEWRSAEAIASAHSNPAVQQMWAEFAEVCDYLPLSSLAESSDLFAEFATFP
jgi:hypothetical protein